MKSRPALISRGAGKAGRFHFGRSSASLPVPPDHSFPKNLSFWLKYPRRRQEVFFSLKDGGSPFSCGPDIAAEGRKQLASDAEFIGRQIGNHRSAIFEIIRENG